MQNATLLMFMSHQSRNNGNMSDVFTIPCWAWYDHAQSIFDVAALIHIVRSGRAATFNDCIHMYLVPYLKSQITPSANDEMIRSHCPPDIGFEIQALAVLGRARYHSVMEAPVLHTILTSDLYE